MDDFARRFAEQGYEPHADDRSHILKALNEQLRSSGDSPRLRRLYDSLIDAADDGADEGILRHATELADLVASRIEPENGCLVFYSCGRLIWRRSICISTCSSPWVTVSRPSAGKRSAKGS